MHISVRRDGPQCPSVDVPRPVCAQAAHAFSPGKALPAAEHLRSILRKACRAFFPPDIRCAVKRGQVWSSIVAYLGCERLRNVIQAKGCCAAWCARSPCTTGSLTKAIHHKILMRSARNLIIRSVSCLITFRLITERATRRDKPHFLYRHD